MVTVHYSSNNMNFTDNNGVMLSQCSDALRSFVTEKIIPQINLNTTPDGLDEYNRPVSFTLEAEGITVKVVWVYIYEDSSNWACSDYQLFIL